MYSHFPPEEVVSKELEVESAEILSAYGDLETSSSFLAWRRDIENLFLGAEFSLKREKQISVNLLVDTYPSTTKGLRHVYASTLPLEEKAASLLISHFEKLGYTIRHFFSTNIKNENVHIFTLKMKDRFF